MSRKKVVVMLSGGMDSTIAFHIAKARYGSDMMGLWLNIGQPYADKEAKVVKGLKYRFSDYVEMINLPILHSRFGNMPTVDQQVIPGRNFTLATIGAHFGDEVWICALDGEMHDKMPDKNEQFFTSITSALTQAYGFDVKVVTPFLDLTKAELIRYALDLGVREEEILNTSTCYDPVHAKCGECSACVKRWIALRLNDMREKTAKDPAKSEWAQAYKAYIRLAWDYQDFSHYNEKRIKETMQAFNMDETPPLFPREKDTKP
jgi:7-cyano-7-deazaguanine synthase